MRREAVRTRFAPSPTGYLHLGHAYSALLNYNFAKEHNGSFLLRIEDIDPTRCKPMYTEAIFEDLAWLGLEWETPVHIQSEHRKNYTAAIQRLQDLKVVYPCFCTRKEILGEVKRAGYAPHGPEGTLYPGTCRRLGAEEQKEKISGGEQYALRLDVEKALEMLDPDLLYWMEESEGPIKADPRLLGDIVIARKDIGTSYHLSVVVDDALQEITHVIRGNDLKYATHIQRLLQILLECPLPFYRHHFLQIDQETGMRFSKRDDSKTLRSYREQGYSPEKVKKLISL